MHRRVLLGLGSNLGDRRRLLKDAVDSLPGVTKVSGLYETDPVGGPAEQDKYLNLVVAIDSDATPRQLLGMCHRLESAAGRVRGERWGPRPLDIDILWIDGERVDEEDLCVPHPRMWERRFVLVPLADVAPELLPEGWEDGVDGWVSPAEPL
ncbi:MAG: 2-amino-4-hydroxy-6-hydroxymethyldihydropteridine diphosphokinase [Acidimicrobiaceae bacterium]|jgi:2-amino-4-hydroxy-6-hydroxymethyldihydropteridine diphosphokinase